MCPCGASEFQSRCSTHLHIIWFILNFCTICCLLHILQRLLYSRANICSILQIAKTTVHMAPIQYVVFHILQRLWCIYSIYAIFVFCILQRLWHIYSTMQYVVHIVFIEDTLPIISIILKGSNFEV